MWACKLCEIETVYTTYICEKCRKIKHLINLYGDRVYEVLDSVLVRTPNGQDHKINHELKTEKEKINVEESSDADKVLTRGKKLEGRYSA